MSVETLDSQVNNYSKQSQPILNINNQQSLSPLPRSLSALETWGFGLTGHLVWIGTAPAMHAALGVQAIFVWLPAVIVGVLLNYQVKSLGQQWPEMAGGTPNYTSRLLSKYPILARYGAIAYFFGWAGFIPGNAIIVTELIKANLEPLGITCPTTLFSIGFTLIAYVVAFSGTRALGILHSFFVLPAMGFLLLFCIQGLGWLTFSPLSPGLLPSSWIGWQDVQFVEWAKWYFFAIYGAYACETASSFVADSHKPQATLKYLSFVAWLIPPVYIGASWVLMRLATQPGLGDNTFLNLLSAATPFWGRNSSFCITLLIASSCLMSCATSVSNCPRVLYQLALDKKLSPLFTVVDKRDVFVPGLLFTLLPSLICLIWGDVTNIVLVTSTSYLLAMMSVHLGLWVGRNQPGVRWPWLSLGFLLLEVVVLIFGGLAWSWQDVIIGLLFPLGILAVDSAISYIPFPPFHPDWWLQLDRKRSTRRIKDFVAFQVVILLLLVCGAATLAWVIRSKFEHISPDASNALLIVLLMAIAFIAIAIACWTSLPQVAAIDEAREQAENLFIAALDTVPDTILVVNERGVICQANPAAQRLFGLQNDLLMGQNLQEFLPELVDSAEDWPHISEQILTPTNSSSRIIEATISQRSNHQFFEYIVILRDITERKRSEVQLREQTEQLKITLQQLQQTQAQLIQTEKMSSLGQLVAGVAHEINNPINFIYGNINYVEKYTHDLVSLIGLYQRHCSEPIPDIQKQTEEIDLDYLIKDLPRTLSSMKTGTERISQLVLTLRNFSRLDESDMKKVNIHEGIDSTLLVLQNRFKATSTHPAIQIVKQYSNLPSVECYAGQLNQVFMHILNNSIDALLDLLDKNHNFSNPCITIYTQQLERNWFRVGIKDNGIGMSEKTRLRVFDPFFTTKPVGKGSGLGLSVSYEIVVNKHKGRLDCISELGKGTEFKIDIPTYQNKAVNFSSN